VPPNANKFYDFFCTTNFFAEYAQSFETQNVLGTKKIRNLSQSTYQLLADFQPWNRLEAVISLKRKSAYQLDQFKKKAPKTSKLSADNVDSD
jgi:hypothetical protein